MCGILRECDACCGYYQCILEIRIDYLISEGSSVVLHC